MFINWKVYDQMFLIVACIVTLNYNQAALKYLKTNVDTNFVSHYSMQLTQNIFQVCLIYSHAVKNSSR